MQKTIPDGYWVKANGELTPESMVKPVDRQRDEFVRALVARAEHISQLLAEFKGMAFTEFDDFVQMSAKEYKAKLGGTKGNVTLLSYDGSFKVVRQIQEHLSFDERLQAAKQLIDECIQTWAEGSSDEIKALINNAFQVSKEGQINTASVLGLKRLNIKDKKWQRAMQAISDSVQVSGTKPYIRFYKRVGDGDQYQAISLDLANA